MSGRFEEMLVIFSRPPFPAVGPHHPVQHASRRVEERQVGMPQNSVQYRLGACEAVVYCLRRIREEVQLPSHQLGSGCWIPLALLATRRLLHGSSCVDFAGCRPPFRLRTNRGRVAYRLVRAPTIVDALQIRRAVEFFFPQTLVDEVVKMAEVKGSGTTGGNLRRVDSEVSSAYGSRSGEDGTPEADVSGVVLGNVRHTLRMGIGARRGR